MLEDKLLPRRVMLSGNSLVPPGCLGRLTMLLSLVGLGLGLSSAGFGLGMGSEEWLVFGLQIGSWDGGWSSSTGRNQMAC